MYHLTINRLRDNQVIPIALADSHSFTQALEALPLTLEERVDLTTRALIGYPVIKRIRACTGEEFNILLVISNQQLAESI